MLAIAKLPYKSKNVFGSSKKLMLHSNSIQVGANGRAATKNVPDSITKWG